MGKNGLNFFECPHGAEVEWIAMRCEMLLFQLADPDALGGCIPPDIRSGIISVLEEVAEVRRRLEN